MLSMFDQEVAIEDYGFSMYMRGKEEGRKEGIEEGRKKGIEEGRKVGIEEGRKESIEEGRKEGIEKVIKKVINERSAEEKKRIIDILVEEGVLTKEEAIKY